MHEATRSAQVAEGPIPELRIGLVGIGSIARTHLAAIRALPAVAPLRFRPRVAALVSRRPGEVGGLAAAMGVENVYETVEEALAASAADVYDVTSANDRHAADAGPVLAASLPLYIEKPVTRSPFETAALVRASGSSLTQVGLVMRYHPAATLARALLRAGAIGELRHGRLTLLHGSYLDPARPLSWRLQAERAGGGAMLDLGLHLVDLARFVAGEVSVAHAVARTVVPERPGGRVDVDDWAWAELEVRGGGFLTLEASRVEHGGEGSLLELHGSAGSMSADLTAREPVRLRRFDSDEAAHLARAQADPEVRAAAGLLPPERLSLGLFADLHAAALRHFFVRALGDDPAPGLAAVPADSLAAEEIAHAVVAGAGPRREVVGV